MNLESASRAPRPRVRCAEPWRHGADLEEAWSRARHGNATRIWGGPAEGEMRQRGLDLEEAQPSARRSDATQI